MGFIYAHVRSLPPMVYGTLTGLPNMDFGVLSCHRGGDKTLNQQIDRLSSAMYIPELKLRNKGRSSGAAVKALTERRFGPTLLEVHIHAKRSRCRRSGIRGPCSEIGPSLYSRCSLLAHNRASSQLTVVQRNHFQPLSPWHGPKKICRLFTSLGN